MLKVNIAPEESRKAVNVKTVEAAMKRIQKEFPAAVRDDRWYFDDDDGAIAPRWRTAALTVWKNAADRTDRNVVAFIFNHSDEPPEPDAIGLYAGIEVRAGDRWDSLAPAGRELERH